MASAAPAIRSARTHDAGPLDPAVLSRTGLVCDFINAEGARLRNQTIAVGVVAAVGAVALPLLTGIGDPRIPLLLAAGVIAFWFVRARAEFASACANIAAKRLVAAVDRELAYKAVSSFTAQQFTAMDVFPGRVERFKTRDEVSGRAGGLPFTLQHVRAEGAERGVVIFDGVIARLEVPEPFPGHTVIVPDGASDGVIGAGSRVKKDLVFLKSPAFEERFSVYASDYYDARRLVTPPLMEIILEAATHTPGALRFAFVQRSLFVALPGAALRLNAGLFAPPLAPRQAIGKLVLLLALLQRLAKVLAR